MEIVGVQGGEVKLWMEALGVWVLAAWPAVLLLGGRAAGGRQLWSMRAELVAGSFAVTEGREGGGR